MIVKLVLFFGILGSALCSFPNYQQCDSKWKNVAIGTLEVTMCQKGSLIASVSSMLKHYGVKVDGQDADPKALNEWLKKNKGYKNENEFVPDSIDKLKGVTYIYQLSEPLLMYAAYMLKQTCVINVNKKSTWAVVTKATKDSRGNISFSVMDPALAKTSYAANEVSLAECYVSL